MQHVARGFRSGIWTMLATVVACLSLGGPASAATWRVEAENAGDGDTDYHPPDTRIVTWKVEDLPGASAGSILGGVARFESNPIRVAIPRAGAYHLWVRHLQTPGKPSNFYVLFRDDIGQAVAVRKVDWQPRVPTQRPYVKPAAAAPDAKPVLVWSSTQITFERPMNATVCFGPAAGLGGGKVGLDCLVLSDESSVDPQSIDVAGLPLDPGPSVPVPAPAGMQPAPVFTMHSSFFAGNTDPQQQFKLALKNNSSLFRDYPWLLQLGANRDNGWGNGSVEYGFRTLMAAFGEHAPDLIRDVKPPEGRFVNADGAVGRTFSLSYEPYRKASLEHLAKDVAWLSKREDRYIWSIQAENAGFFDYSQPAVQRFHQFLQDRYGTIAKLNDLWKTQHESFDAVPLPRNTDENKACWFAFREFSSLEHVTLVAERAKLIRQLDPQKQPVTSAASCAHIMSPFFTASAPMDYEELINIGFADQPNFAFDSYSTEDVFVGSDTDFILSLIGDRILYNTEFNTHAQDPRIMARSYWGQIGKGVKGIAVYQFNGDPFGWSSAMWGMLKTDFTPRDKLAPVADANQEIHRLERLLWPARPIRSVKPVAFYYSRMDLSLPQPLFDVYGCSIDNPYRVYGVLRGLGYPVRWITPRQIEAGELEGVGAVVMLDVKYVPEKTVAALESWVKDGGCLIGDQWPGVFNEYGHPQKGLMDVFGIRTESTTPLADKAGASGDAATETMKQARLKFQETTTTLYGVDPEVLEALDPSQVSKKVTEMWDQWDAIHPVAKAVGNWHLSGYDFKKGKAKVQCVSGHVIGTGMGGGPAMVINAYGKGHALYSSLMLGSLYESGPIRSEWDSVREGPALGNILDAYLRFCGLQPSAQPRLLTPIARKMRIEVPLVDAKKNVLIGMISTNDAPLSPFPLTVRWPASAAAPKLVLACVGGSRQLQKLPFEMGSDSAAAGNPSDMTVTMAGFDTHATLLALTDSDPLVGLAFAGAPRTTGGLLDVTPGTRLTLKVTVWNPSPRELSAGAVTLFTAPGWFCSQGEMKVPAIAPYASREVELAIAAPAICAQRTLRAIMVRYQAGDVTSTPATELVWWRPAEQPDALAGN